MQRVRDASVTVDGRVTGAIARGLLVLAGVTADDTAEDRDWLVRKIVQLRVFDDDAGVMNRSVQDVGGDDPRRVAVHAVRVDAQGQPALLHGGRPAGRRGAGVRRVRRGARGGVGQARSHRRLRRAHAWWQSVNDGPVTIWLDSRARE